MSYGDPCRTRMKVHYDGYWWRVFELAQRGQTASLHPDSRWLSWKTAMSVANSAVLADREKCRKYNALLGEPHA